MGASGTDNFCLRWNDFAENVSGAFKDLRAESDFFDVTLACSDSGARTLPAHKVILSACSNFFKTTFRQQMNANKHPNPYIYLRGVTYNDLASILDFIYNGEVNVAQEDLNSFLAVAEELQIKGLTNRDNTSGAENNSNSKRPKIRQANPDTPPVKKVRRSSPVPSSSSSSGAAASQIVTPVIDDKEVVNIKDDPEAVLASTSAVNPDDSADFGGEEYDESYDNYYEDEGAELGEGAEGSDGTKGSQTGPSGNVLGAEFQPQMVAVQADGRTQCIVCGSWYSSLSVARTHVQRMHLVPQLFQCTLCSAVIAHRLDFAKHVNRRHKIKGAKDIVKNYAIPLKNNANK